MTLLVILANIPHVTYLQQSSEREKRRGQKWWHYYDTAQKPWCIILLRQRPKCYAYLYDCALNFVESQDFLCILIANRLTKFVCIYIYAKHSGSFDDDAYKNLTKHCFFPLTNKEHSWLELVMGILLFYLALCSVRMSVSMKHAALQWGLVDACIAPLVTYCDKFCAETSITMQLWGATRISK